MNKSNCVGCWFNHYNEGDGECWSLESAKVVTRYRIHMDLPMNAKANYQRVSRPNCFYSGGYSGDGYAYLDKIPSYAK